jgi:uncharacterized protein YbjT (DUF2867 family)
MIVLVTGANGFIGAHLLAALRSGGHEPVASVRSPRKLEALPAGVRSEILDFAELTEASDWLPHLRGVEAVVNCVGLLRERGTQSFVLLHERAPRALFAACAEAGVRRIVQLSALGADEHAFSAYHLSKRRADNALLAGPVPAAVVQPSLVYGPGGGSARLFALMASLPLIPLPGRGEQPVQPIHVDDLVEAILRLLSSDVHGRIALVGPEPLSFAGLLSRLRHAMGFGAARYLPLPLPLMRAAAALGALLPGSLFDRDSLRMLEAGNTADATATAQLLGRAPRGVEAFVAAPEREVIRTQALLSWLLPLMRGSLAVVWIVTALLSFGLYPLEDSYALLARTGIHGMLAPLALYGAAAVDLALGVALLLPRRPRGLYWAQAAVIVSYTALITVFLPEYWRHPYGPILKNLPFLAAILLLAQLEGPRAP